jgi:hypothetical protein
VALSIGLHAPGSEGVKIAVLAGVSPDTLLLRKAALGCPAAGDSRILNPGV